MPFDKIQPGFDQRYKHLYIMLRKDPAAEGEGQRQIKRLNQLYQERKDIINNIKGLNRRKRCINDGQRQPKMEDQSFKKEHKLTMSSQQIKSSQSLGQHHTHLNTNEEQIKKVIDIQSSIKDRNRRLFGGLNIHLKQASNQLKDEQSKAKNKKSVEQQALQKEKELCQKLQDQKRKEIEKSLQKLMGEKEKNSKQLLQTENVILKNKFITYVSDLQNFLYTKSKPSIAWKSASTNPQIETLYKKQAASFKDELAKKEEEIMGYNQKFDFTQYTHANQKEYYNNTLDSYFRSKNNFIVTKKSPPIAWAPSAQGLAKVEAALSQSKQRLSQEFASRKEENDHFYKRFSKEHHLQQQIDQAQSESGH